MVYFHPINVFLSLKIGDFLDHQDVQRFKR